MSNRMKKENNTNKTANRTKGSSCVHHRAIVNRLVLGSQPLHSKKT